VSTVEKFKTNLESHPCLALGAHSDATRSIPQNWRQFLRETSVFALNSKQILGVIFSLESEFGAAITAVVALGFRWCYYSTSSLYSCMRNPRYHISDECNR